MESREGSRPRGSREKTKHNIKELHQARSLLLSKMFATEIMARASPHCFAYSNGKLHYCAEAIHILGYLKIFVRVKLVLNTSDHAVALIPAASDINTEIMQHCYL